ncbi:hypothetical protein QYE76_013390 [Lolium multiflorum]|uniref:Chitin-binding type-1 domain-containing protein n=1 Tax=Lolium multiflorum TaxID=4521 RepID=A0AAD8X4I6_LOLMU|nr:hypothetical protein QYE76_013390 [Lolium multiflorum]
MSTPRTHPTLSAILILAVLAAVLATAARAQTCGSQAGGATCANCLCCSQFGFCGNTSDYCGAGCQSQCTGCSPVERCGSQFGGAMCAGCLCCSQFGFCGGTREPTQSTSYLVKLTTVIASGHPKCPDSTTLLIARSPRSTHLLLRPIQSPA